MIKDDKQNPEARIKTLTWWLHISSYEIKDTYKLCRSSAIVILLGYSRQVKHEGTN